MIRYAEPRTSGNRWRLRVIFAALCAVLVSGVWIAAWAADEHEREAHIDDLAARVRTSANAYALAIGARLRMVDQMLLYAAADYERDPERFDLQYWLKQLPSIEALSPQFSLADKNGIVRQSSLGPSAQGVSVADREHFVAHVYVDTKRLHVGRIVVGRTSNRRSIQLSRRVNDRTGAFAGVLVFSVDPDFFLDVLDQMKVGVQGGGAVRREGGAPILRVAGMGRQVVFDKPVANFERYESADAANLGYLYGADVIRASRAIDDYDVIVDSEGNVAEALAEIAIRRSFIWLVAGAVTAVIVGMFLLMFFDLLRTCAGCAQCSSAATSSSATRIAPLRRRSRRSRASSPI